MGASIRCMHVAYAGMRTACMNAGAGAGEGTADARSRKSRHFPVLWVLMREKQRASKRERIPNAACWLVHYPVLLRAVAFTGPGAFASTLLWTRRACALSQLACRSSAHVEGQTASQPRGVVQGQADVRVDYFWVCWV